MAQRIQVQLQEEDVRKDLNSILEDMDKIRRESIAEGTPQKKNEYRALAYRLASCFKGLYKEEFQPRIKTIEESVSANGLLSSYDRLQAPYWSSLKEGKEFVMGLAELAIQFFQPQDFIKLFDKTAEYHLFQALNILAKKDASPVQKGLPLEAVLSLIDVEEMNDILVMAEAYKRCGYLTAELKSSKPGNHAEKLKKHGYDASPDNKKITIKFNELPADKFFQLAFGYESIRPIGDYYAACMKQGDVILNRDGSKVNLLEKEFATRVTETNIDGKKMLELQSGGKFAYLSKGGLLYNRWLDQKLTDKIIKAIESIHRSHGNEIAKWLLDSAIPLQELENVSGEGASLVYRAGIRPTGLLLAHAPAMAQCIDDLTEFAQAYDCIQAVELPGKQSFWEILELLPEDIAQSRLDVAVQAYRTHGKKLKPMLQAYQDRRTTHQSIETLLPSVLDYISAIKEKF